jgi:hypothetical protein
VFFLLRRSPNEPGAAGFFVKQAERGEFALGRLHEAPNMAETAKFSNWKAPPVSRDFEASASLN